MTISAAHSKRRSSILLFVGMGTMLSAQEGPAMSPPTTLGEIIVTATRLEQDIRSVPYSAHVIKREEFVDRLAARTLADTLRETPGVMIQRTAYGQASPFIRGFTGFRTLMLVDGIRLNNAVFRDGPNQYWGTIDPLSIDHLDVVKGPTSVLYGSDAIGGTVNAFTLLPAHLSASHAQASSIGTVGNAPHPVHGSGYYRYASAENSHTVRGNVMLRPTAGFGLVAGATARDFDDLRGGASTGLQLMSGYRERSADLKFNFHPTDTLHLTAAYQRVRQDEVPRTHATIYAKSFAGTVPGTDIQRNHDQSRDLAYVQFALREPAAWLARAHLSLSWHRQAEEQDRIRSNFRREITGFSDDQYGVLLNFSSPAPIGQLAYGLEYYHDDVTSSGTDSAPGRATRMLPRGPVADAARYRLFGLYFQEQIVLLKRLELTAGVRYTAASAEAANVDPDLTDAIVFGPLDKSAAAVTGSIRVRYDVTRSWNVFGGVSQGFRAPNLSDYTSFEVARSGERETPAPQLTPEDYVSFELGSKARIPALRTELYGAWFLTRIRDQITRFPTGRFVNGEREVTKANTGDGYIHGVEAGLVVALDHGWSLHGNLTWTEGKVDTFLDRNLLRKPASRIQPFSVLIGPRWHSTHNRFWVEGTARFSARQSRLSPGDALDNQRIPPGGTPGYHVFDLRSGWRVRPNLTITTGVENVLNHDYRIHGSGINEPGLNLITSLNASF